MARAKRVTTISGMALIVLLLVTCVYGQEPATWQRSYTLEAQGQPQSALVALDALPVEARETYLYRVRRAWLLERAGRHQESVGAYLEALEMAPRAIEPRTGMLAPLIALGRFRDAETQARSALELDADNYVASRSLAWALYNLSRFAEAEVVYRRVLELYPSDVEMRAGIGWCLLRRGREGEARAEFRAVLRVSPSSAAARTGLDVASAR